MDDNQILNDASEYLSSRDVAELYRVTHDHVSRLCRQGRLAATQRGGIWLIEKGSAARFFDSKSKPVVIERMISSRDAASLYRVTHDHIARLCRQGKLTGTLRDGMWLVDTGSLDVFFKHRAKVEQAPASATTSPSEKLVYVVQKELPVAPPTTLPQTSVPASTLVVPTRVSLLRITTSFAALLLLFVLLLGVNTAETTLSRSSSTAEAAALGFLPEPIATWGVNVIDGTRVAITSFKNFFTFYSNPFPTIVLEAPQIFYHLADRVPSSATTTRSVSNSYATYNTFIEGVSKSYLDQVLVQLRTEVYRNIDSTIRPYLERPARSSGSTSLSLTTSGTSGAATLSGNVLNIPQYTGGGSGTIGSGTVGQIPYYSGATALTATSSLFIDTTGYLGLGTTSPGTILSIGDGADAINFSNTATSTFSYGINIKGGCFAVDGVCFSDGPGLSSVSATYPITGNGTIGSPLVLAFGTSTANTWGDTQTFTNNPILGSLSGLIYGNSGTLASTATSTLSFSSFPARLTGTLGSLVGGTNSSFTWWGLATTTNIVSGNLLYGSGANGVANVATSTPTAGTGISLAGTGSVVGGSLSITNTGVTSVAATYPLITSAATGNITLSTALATTTIRQEFGTAQLGNISFATSSDANLRLNITNSGGAFTFAPVWNGVLSILRGGTASTTPLGGILVGNGTNPIKSLVVGTGLTFDGTTLASTASGGTVTQVDTSSSVTGLTLTGGPITTTGTVTLGLTAGYTIPLSASTTEWDTAYLNRITSASAPLSFANNTLSITQAGAATNGYLSSTDWNTFNNKAGFAWPFTVQTGYVSTSTTVGFLQGLFSTASSTFSGPLRFSSLTPGGLAVGTGGLVYSAATTTAGTGLTYSGNAFNVNTTQDISRLSNLTSNGVVYTSAGNGTLNVGATSTLSFSSFPARLTGTLGSLVGGTNSSFTWWGLATTTNIVPGNLLYGSGANGVANVATSTPSLGLGLSYVGGTLGSFVGGSSGTFSIATSSLYSGSTGQFPYFSDTNTITATSSIFLATNGRIGIGTTTPGTILSIGNGTTAINFSNTATSTFSYGLNIRNGCYAIGGSCLSAATFGLTNYWTLSGGNIFNNNAGKVGVGTSTPWGQLSASSTSAYPTLAIQQLGAGPAATFLGGNVGIGTTSPYKTLSVGGNVGINGDVQIYGNTLYEPSGMLSSGAWFGDGSGYYVQVAGFQDTLTANANILFPAGISAANDTFVLENLAQTLTNKTLTSPVLTTPTLSGGTQGSVLFLGTSGTITQNNSSFFWHNTRTTLGLGTTTPRYKLTIATSTAPQLSLAAGTGIAQWTFRNAGGNLYVASTSAAGTATSSIAALSITGSNAYVGIGVNAPTQKLDVAGNVNVTATSGYYQGGSRVLFAPASYEATYVGIGAGNANPTGGANSALGYQSLYNTTTGIQNTALGHSALYTNFNGGRNTAVGWYAGYSNQSGTDNVAIGNAALENASSSYNTALGSFALNAVTTGEYNIGIGYQAGNTNPITGSNNILIGNNVDLPNANSSNMLSIGNLIYGTGLSTSAGTGVSTGNIGIGTTSPQYKLSVLNSTAPQLALASGAGVAQWTFRNAGSNLYLATTTANGSATTTLPAFTILGSTGRVGIATSSPGSLFSIANVANFKTGTSTIYENLNVRGQLKIGTGSIYLNGAATSTFSNGISLAAGNIISSPGAFSINSGAASALNIDSGTTGALNLGTSANAKTITIGNSTGATAVNITTGTGNFALNTNQLFVNQSTGYVGIGTTSPSETLTVNGNLLFVKESARTISVGDSTTSNTAGAALSILGAAATSGAANGGAISITGGASTGTSGNGGAVTITGGAGKTGTFSTGGAISLTSGGTSWYSGAITIATAGSAESGDLTLSTGSAGFAASAGDISLTAGSHSSTGSAGNILLTAGSNSSSGAAGSITINAGNSTSGTVGNVLLNSGGVGKVGIGLASPATMLDIDTGSNTTGLRIRGLAETVEIADISVGSAGQLILSTANTGDSGAFIEVDAEDDLYGLIIRDSNTGSTQFANVYMADAATDYLNIVVNNTAATAGLVVSDDDYVGIGDTTPAARLSIVNNVATNFLDTYAEYQVLLYDSGVAATSYGLGIKNNTMVFNSGVGGYSFDDAGGSSSMVIDSSGNVGIGTASPYNKFDIVADTSGVANAQASAGLRIDANTSLNDTAFLAGVDSTNNLAYIQAVEPLVSWTTRPLILQPNGGSIGIGDTTPSYTLDVNGTLRTTSNLTVDGTTMTLTSSGFVGINNINSNSTIVVFAADANNDGSTEQFQFRINDTVAGGARLAQIDTVGIYTDNMPAPGNSTVCRDASGESYFGSCTSLLKYKENIRDLPLGLDTVLALKPHLFDWRYNMGSPDDLGFIAEEVEAISPILTEYNDNGELTGVKYASMAALFARAIQQLDARERLFASSTTIRLDSLESRLAMLENGLISTTSSGIVSSLGESALTQLITWFGNASNGIQDLYATAFHAEEVHTRTLCVKRSDDTDICVTGDELAALLAAQNISPVQAPSDEIIITDTPSGAVTPPDTSTTTPAVSDPLVPPTDTDETTVETAPTPSPDTTGENVAESATDTSSTPDPAPDAPADAVVEPASTASAPVETATL